MHRGKAKRGPAHGSYKTGLYSKFLPSRLANGYEAMLEDSRLLSLKDDTASLVALIQEAMAKLDTGETGALWAELRDLWADMMAAPTQKKGALLTEIGRLIERGASDAAAVREIRGLILDKARVAESERKRLVEAHQVVTMDRLAILVGAISSAIIAEVSDRDARGRILDRVDRLLRSGSGELAAGDAEGNAA